MSQNSVAWPPKTTHLRVDELLIDLRFRRIIHQYDTAELSQRIFDLLLVFLSEPHVLHTRSALFERVWPGLYVDDANLSQSIWMLRRALGNERKAWIRTVAKSGYVFEPPGLIEIANVPQTQPSYGVSDSEPEPLAIVQAPHRAAVVAAHTASHRSFRGLLLTAGKRLAMAASLACVSVLAGSEASRAAPDTGIAAVHLVLIRVNDGASHTNLEWPVRLLDTWLSWKLDSLPEVVRLTQEDLGADEMSSPPRVLLLMSGRSPDRPDEIFLRVSSDSAGAGNFLLPTSAKGSGGKQIELRGPVSDVPRMVDAISRQAIAQLLPHRTGDHWPALSLRADEAKSYAEAAEAIHRRDWVAALLSAQNVVQRAPDFGPARLLLTQVFCRKGEPTLATEQIRIARTKLTTLPADAKKVLDAQWLASTPGFETEATAAYAALVARYPERTDFSITQAALMTRASKPDEALGILSRPEWRHKPRSMRIDHLIALAETEMVRGLPAMAAKHAQQAIGLIGKTEKGWEVDLGTAQMLLATANHSLYDRKDSWSAYEKAARTFESGGARIDAMHARYLAEITRTHAPESEPRVQALLDEARIIGDRGLEIEILLNIASAQFSDGEHVDARRNLQQALTIANTAGDAGSQQAVEVKLLMEDILAGDLRAVEQRLRRIARLGKLWGNNQFRLAQSEATLHMVMGSYDASLASLKKPELRDKVTAANQPPRAIAHSACLRGKVMLFKGDLASARKQLEKCRYKPSSTLMRTAGSLEVWVELLAGHRQRAMELAADCENILGKMPDSVERWTYGLSLADALVRLGEHPRAERIYLDIIGATRQVGYGLLIANAETGLAEIAAIRSDWSKSKQYADAARSRVPADLWTINSRLDQVDIADAIQRRDDRAAQAMLAALKAKADRHGDMVVQIGLDSLPTIRSDGVADMPRHNNAARAGLHGARLDWLIAPQRKISNAALATTLRR